MVDTQPTKPGNEIPLRIFKDESLSPSHEVRALLAYSITSLVYLIIHSLGVRAVVYFLISFLLGRLMSLLFNYLLDDYPPGFHSCVYAMHL